MKIELSMIFRVYQAIFKGVMTTPGSQILESITKADANDDERSPHKQGQSARAINVTDDIRTPSWGVMSPCL